MRSRVAQNSEFKVADKKEAKIFTAKAREREESRISLFRLQPFASCARGKNISFELFAHANAGRIPNFYERGKWKYLHGILSKFVNHR